MYPGACLLSARRIHYRLYLGLVACGCTGGAEPHPHETFPASFLSTSPLSGQPRAGCLSGREPSLRLGPNQQTLQSRCCGPKRMLSLPSACAPTASPGSPWLPPVASPPTSPRAGRATVALTGCRLRRWQKRGTTQRSGGGTRKVGCRVWKHFFRLVCVANRLWAAALTQPSPGHQGRRCPQDSKPRKIQAHENPHAGAAGRGAAPRGNRGQCRGRRCTGRSRDRPSWGQGEWLSAKGRAVGVLRFGCCRTPGGGRLCLHGGSTKGCVGKGWNRPIRLRCRPGRYLAPTGRGTLLGRPGETRRGHPLPRDVPVPSPPGAEEMLSPPASELRAGINPGGS